MKLIIAGSRTITDYQILRTAILESGLWARYGKKIQVVSGKAKGMDTLGEEFATKAGLKIHEFKADWDGLGKRAGILRNEDMGNFADEALVVMTGNSRGSIHMAKYMRRLDKPCYVYPLRIDADVFSELEALGCIMLFPRIFDSGEIT